MLQKSFYSFLICFWAGTLIAQEVDSLKTHQLGEVVVTATRTERTVGALPMPVLLIQKAQLQTMGSLRLNDALTEQTGLVVVPQVNGQGSGIQLQGFNPDYTLILMDGEPIVGRYTGSLELSRIAIGNIKQIEIVKGPSSSLYGSDALAGVINIITERPAENKVRLQTRYGTNNTSDANVSASAVGSKLSTNLFVNRFSTDGYDLSPQNYGKTVSPYWNYTLNGKVNYTFSSKAELSLSGRHFNQEQSFGFDVLSNNISVRTAGSGWVKDWSANPVLTLRPTNRIKSVARYYHTAYSTRTDLQLESDGTPYYHDDFLQTFSRPEVTTEYFANEKNILTVGAGFINETVQTSRYGDDNVRKQQTTYGFFQHEWTPLENLNVIAGGRYDHNSVYGSQFSPKLSYRYEISRKIALKGSFGLGFKAPDFRQLYFNFNNSAAGGYSVIGTEIIGDRLRLLESEGQIQTYLFDPSLLGSLKAERSNAINLGGQAHLYKKLSIDVNLFYNYINNLIETQAVAITSTNQSIFSYRNIKKAFTQGAESNLNYAFAKNLTLSFGYQLLYAKDRDVAKAVRAGDVYYRDPVTLTTRRLHPSEYFGLYNRSRHQGNIKLFYADPKSGWEASLRVIYRGKFGIGDIRGNIQGETLPPSDVNNNAILDKYDNFVSGYALVNISAAKMFHKINLRVQVGVDNLFDYTDPLFIPNLPGRLYYAGLNYTLNQKNKIN